MNAIIQHHGKEIAALCQRYRVEQLDLFGSAASDEFDDQHSDFDFIVRFADADAPGIARRYFDLIKELERLFGRPVDLLTDRPFRNPYFALSVQETRQTVYEQGNEEIPV